MKKVIVVGFLIILMLTILLGCVEGNTSQKNVYQKLADGDNINMLIVGDSIGAPSGEDAWSTLLIEFLEDTYQVDVNTVNVSMGGNTSYAGYARIMMLEEKEDYDLAIICYGQNDAEDKFSIYYEDLLIALKERFSNCSIISILESSQREYTNKMKNIMELAKYYNIPIADTIAAFEQSGKSHEMLTEDGVHPNAEGHILYFETIRDVVLEQMNFYEISEKRWNQKEEEIKRTASYKVEDFKRIDKVTFEVKVNSGRGRIGLFYDYLPGDNRVEIYSGKKFLEKIEFDWPYGFRQEHIDMLSKEYTIDRKIRVVFLNEDQANGFQGLIIDYLE